MGCFVANVERCHGFVRRSYRGGERYCRRKLSPCRTFPATSRTLKRSPTRASTRVLRPRHRQPDRVAASCRRRQGNLARNEYACRAHPERDLGTDMAINGDGYFSVQAPTSFSRQHPDVRRRRQLYQARRLQLDASGYLVNGAGYYLEGIRSIRRPATRPAALPRRLQFPEQSSAGDCNNARSTTRSIFRLFP